MIEILECMFFVFTLIMVIAIPVIFAYKIIEVIMDFLFR